MKVIYERTDLVDKIDNVINNSEKKVVRIELTNEEFTQFLDELLTDTIYVINSDGCYRMVSFCLKQDRAKDFRNTSCCIEYSLKGNYGCYSGSYIVYKGVCIQTHQDYKE